MASSAAKAFGGEDAYEDDMAEEAPPDEDGDDAVPPEFESAYAEYEANPTASTAYRMIEACKGGGSGGLALLIGSGKGKSKKT